MKRIAREVERWADARDVTRQTWWPGIGLRCPGNPDEDGEHGKAHHGEPVERIGCTAPQGWHAAGRQQRNGGQEGQCRCRRGIAAENQQSERNQQRQQGQGPAQFDQSFACAPQCP
ncbi:hypothetical protein SDC9_190958 [bioreactor metagenome]|uniref:Uncharacterized protein n=1 Tax=bioreactor metagenome TaxID=1076179 RepID=A0A645HYY4_9ZZZZ